MTYGSYEFLPAPVFSWTTNTIRDSQFEPLFVRNTLDFDGTLITDSAASGQLNNVLDKITELQSALAVQKQEFRIDYDGIPILSGIFPRVNSVNIEEDTWIEVADYTFQFEYDEQLADAKARS
jgi:hypothetical protein